MIKQLILFLLLLSIVAFPIQAETNNKHGVHLAQPHYEDIEKAAEMVNSNGGDWGYVTLVLQENDRELGKWQDIFNKLRELKLIPIIRLATKPEGNAWRRPEPEEATSWVSFLNELNWVVKPRYVILFNEPNHGLEWGGEVDAKHYARVARAFAEEFKKADKNYVVMPAGFDASAPASLPNYEDESRFIKQMVDEIGIEKFNQLFSAWSSHSYPNPGFAGSPYDRGRGTITTYNWELSYLQDLGVKQMPVFITETGWDGVQINRNTVADYLEKAYTNVWIPDDRVKAITPFVLNYQSEPFTKFSFARPDNDGYYPQFDRMQEINKIAGEPEIEEKGFVRAILPIELVVFSSYRFKIDVKNTGQAIWDIDDGYHLVLEGADPAHYFFSDIQQIKPGEQTNVDLYIKTGEQSLSKDTRLALYKNEEKVIEGSRWRYEIVASPSLTFKTRLYPKLNSDGDDYELQLFDENEELVYKKKGLRVRGGKGELKELQNVALGGTYRAVILKPYYLPRQQFLTIEKGENKISFEGMIPTDFNRDGKQDVNDIGELVEKPNLLRLLLP